MGLRMARFDEAVRDPVLITGAVAAMTSGRITLPGGATAIGECFAVIRQHLLHLEGGLIDESLQQAGGLGRGFFAQDFHIDPARGPVDGHEQIAMRRFIRQLRQRLNIDMNEARLIILKGFKRLGVRWTPPSRQHPTQNKRAESNINCNTCQ